MPTKKKVERSITKSFARVEISLKKEIGKLSAGTGRIEKNIERSAITLQKMLEYSKEIGQTLQRIEEKLERNPW